MKRLSKRVRPLWGRRKRAKALPIAFHGFSFNAFAVWPRVRHMRAIGYCRTGKKWIEPSGNRFQEEQVIAVERSC